MKDSSLTSLNDLISEDLQLYAQIHAQPARVALIDEFEDQFKDRYDIDFSKLVELLKSQHPELLV